MVSETHDRPAGRERSAAEMARGDHRGRQQHNERGGRLPAAIPGLRPGVERRGRRAAAQGQNDGDAKLVERIIEGALWGIKPIGLAEYLASCDEMDARDAQLAAEEEGDGEGKAASRAIPGPGPRPSFRTRHLSLVEILERFADAGGIERARKVARGHEEVIRLGIEHLKDEALTTLESLAAGGYMSSAFTMDQYRAMEITRKAAVSVLRLNPFPTRRDSYNDERGPRLSSGREESHRRGAEAQRGWDELAAPFPIGREPSPLAPGSARGSNVTERVSAKTPADDWAGDTDDRRPRDHEQATIETPARKNPPAEPGANGTSLRARTRRLDSHRENVRATYEKDSPHPRPLSQRERGVKRPLPRPSPAGETPAPARPGEETGPPRVRLSPGATFLRSLSAARANESSHPP